VDLARFAVEDMNALRNAIVSITDQFLDGANGEVIASMLGIAQHHGFPTPLMDWTESPYVAAYFAVQGAFHSADAAPTIFAFDRKSWASRNILASDIAEPLPALAFLSPTPWRNPRLLPQQSILMFCNVDNFEDFVQIQSITDNLPYLVAFRLTDRPVEVLRDLRMMGVHAHSLFPGLDGACRGVFEASIEI
jgi:hypothetical protein